MLRLCLLLDGDNTCVPIVGSSVAIVGAKGPESSQLNFKLTVKIFI